jgi:general nucleoside transport system permease protein
VSDTPPDTTLPMPVAEDLEPGEALPPEEQAPGRLAGIARGAVVPVLSILTAFLVGALVITFSDPETLRLFTSDPLAAIQRAVDQVLSAYSALITGALGNPTQIIEALASGDSREIARAFTPISETVLNATPLIFTGLSVALGFRSGLFNIGAEGQLYVGAIFATFAGFAITGLPIYIHLPIAIAAGFLGGALWGFIPGLLKARTGAHEVIVTIMLNYTSYLLLAWVLKTSVFQREGRNDPISKIIQDSAAFPQFVNDPALRANFSTLLALAAAMGVSWLLFRSVRGYEFRAVGLNPGAARYAGMSISRTIILTMVICGGLAGLAGTTQVLGPSRTLTPGFSPGWGFDGIAVALIGGSRPLGVVLAAFLFGALRAGATPMQAATGIPIDLVVVIQALVIMFVAAPALVRGIYRFKAREVTGTEVFAKGWGS